MIDETENWAGTGGEALDRWPDDVNLADHLVYRHLREGRGGNAALLYRGAPVSYAEVAELVQRSAAVLQRCGVRPGDTVVLVMPDTPAFVAAFFGTLAVGAVAVPVNPALNVSDVAYVLSQTRPRVIVLDSDSGPKFKSLQDKSDARVLLAGDFGERVADFENWANTVTGSPAVVAAADAIAYCAFSSGTTGRPKGIPHRHTDILRCAAAYSRPVLGMSHRDRTLAVPKLCFGYGLGGNLLSSFLYGGTAILVSETSTARVMADAVARYRPTLILNTPRILSEWLQFGERLDLSSVRLIVSAGELLVPALYERWRKTYDIEVLDGFGSTEMGHVFISNHRGDVRLGSSGRVLSGFEVKLVDDDYKPVPAGTVGQMLARGASAVTEYWNDPERTRKYIRDGWIVTGDLFTQDADGYLYPCGRADDMIKAGCGHWISPQDLENVLLGHASVGDCAVVGWSDGDGLVRPKAYVVPKKGVRPSEELERELRRMVIAAWPELDYKHLGAVEFASDLPRSPMGKLQRSRLKPTTLTEYSYEC